MLGPTHALTAAAAAAMTLPALTHLGLTHGPWDATATVLVAAGTALLPDATEVSRTVSQRLGGHRAATHDPLVAPLVVVGAATLAATWPPLTALATAAAVWGAWTATTGLATATLLTGRRPGGRHRTPTQRVTSTVRRALTSRWWATLGALTAAAVATWVVLPGGPFWWLPAAAAIGIVVGLAGDAVTRRGLPLPGTALGLRSQRRCCGGPVVTGSRVELVWVRAVAVATLVVGVVGVAVAALG